MVVQVLDSVRSMEESLLRLKKKRNKAKADVMSDDDKIRSQLLLDTRAFAEAVRRGSCVCARARVRVPCAACSFGGLSCFESASHLLCLLPLSFSSSKPWA